MKKRITAIVAVTLLLLMALSSCDWITDTSELKIYGNSFLTALRDGDAETSWNMLAENVRSEIGGEEAWNEFAAPYKFTDWEISDASINSSVGQLDGEATLDANTYTIRLVFERVEDKWQVTGMHFKLKE